MHVLVLPKLGCQTGSAAGVRALSQDVKGENEIGIAIKKFKKIFIHLPSQPLGPLLKVKLLVGYM